MQRLNLNPDLPRQRYIFTFDGTVYTVRATWRERLCKWTLDVFLVDGTEVALGCVVNASGTVVRDLNRWDPDAPAGPLLVAWGKDDYAREDLSQDGGIQVAFATRAEWDAILAQLPTDFDVLVTD